MEQVLDCLLQGKLKEGDRCVIVFPNLSPTTRSYVMPVDEKEEQVDDSEEELQAEEDLEAGAESVAQSVCSWLLSKAPSALRKPPKPPPDERGSRGGESREHCKTDGGGRRRGKGAFDAQSDNTRVAGKCVGGGQKGQSDG